MGMLQLDAVVHWSIPVNDLEEPEKFYGEIQSDEPAHQRRYPLISEATLRGQSVVRH